MPEPQQRDYDALAKQAGGIDYDALAAQAQGGSEKPPSVNASWWDRIKEAVTSANQTVKDVEAGAGRMVWNNLPAIGATIGGMAAAPGVVSVPAGAAAGGAVGRGIQMIGDAAVGRPTPTTPVGAASDVALMGAGQGALQAMTEGVSRYALAPALKWGGERLMQNALRVPKDIGAKAAKAGIAPQVVQTMLDEGVNVTEGGLAKLQSLIGKTQGEVSKIVAPLTGDIERPVVASRALSSANRYIREQTNPTADLKALGGMVDEFLHPSVGSAMLNPQEAQAMKVGTYKAIGKKYGTPAALRPAEIDAQMDFARGLKEEIERLADAQGAGGALKAANAREGRLLDALNMAAGRVAQARALNPAGFAFVAHVPSTFMAALVDRNPAVKSMLARGMYQSAAHATGLAPAFLRSMMAAVASSDEAK